MPTNYTYGDLKTLLDEVSRNEHGAFKINIGFGSMLYDTVNKIYWYYHISSNHYLFDRAYTISTNHFFDRILSLNLTEKYYFQRPSSGWVLVGLPHMEIRVALYDFEALQVPIEEDPQGRTLHFKHVPATVSIFSNVPGHTDPVHIRSHGEPQQLVDEFIQKLLRIQATRGRLMSDRYQPVIDALNFKQLESKKKLGEEDREEKCQRHGEEGGWEEEGEAQMVGTKRKRRVSRKKQRQVSRKRTFPNDGAQLSGEDDDGDDSDSDGSDVEELIDDSSDVEENNTSFYRAVDNNVSDSQPSPPTAVQTPPVNCYITNTRTRRGGEETT